MNLLNAKTAIAIVGIVIVGAIVVTANEPVRQAVLGDRQLLPFLQPSPSSTDAIQEWFEQNPAIDATTLVGHDGLYYLQAGNLIGTITSERFSAYDDLVVEGKITDGSTILTKESVDELLRQAKEGTASIPSAPTHASATILDSATLDFTISGQQISGSVTQSGLKTSLITNDVGFITNLVAFTTTNLAEGSNLYWTQARFSSAFNDESTSNLAEGSNLYYTQGRFDSAFGDKTTDQLAEGSNNLYSQWAIATGGIVYGNSVGIGSGNAPAATLDVTGSFAVSGAITANSFTLNGGLLYTNASGVMTQLAVGTAGQCLKSTAGVPSWGDCAAGDSITGAGTTGQLAYFNSNSTLAGGTGLSWDSDASTLTVTGNITMAGNIIPSADITYDLGSPTMQWKDVYIGPGSLYINGQKVLQESGESIVVSADPDQNLVMQTTNTGDIEFAPLGTGAIQLKGNVLMTGGNTFRTTDNTALLFSDGIRAGNLLLSGNVFSTSNTNGNIEFSPNGAGEVYFTGGNVGIGTTTPDYALDVQAAGPGLMRFMSQGATDASLTLETEQTDRSSRLEFTENGTLMYQIGKGATDYFYFYDAINSRDSIRIENNGNVSFLPGGTGDVAVGKYTPSAKLDVEGTFRAAGQTTLANYVTNGGLLLTNGSGVVSQTATGTAGQCLQSAGGGAPVWGACTAISADSLNFTDLSDSLVLDASTNMAINAGLTFSTSGAGNVAFNHTGNTTFASSIGIGGSPTQGLLEVNGTEGSMIVGNGGHVLEFTRGSANYLMASGVNATFEFVVGSSINGGTRKMVIDGDGHLGIGDYFPGAFIEASASGGSSDLLMLSSDDANDGDLFIVKNSGNVGIGNSDPQAKLDVSGTFRASGQTTLSNYVTNGGLLLTSASGVVSQTATGTAGQCLQSAGGGAPTWGACNATNTVTGAGTSGQVAFWNGTNAQTSSNAFVWDNVNYRLGVGGGIGTPTATLDVLSPHTTSNGAQIRANALTTGKGLSIASTSTAMTTGGLLGLSWVPGSATTMTGDMFSINVGPNGTVGNLMNLMNDGLSVFSVSQSQIVANVPVSFRAAGNMSVAHDLIFTNSTSANINSAGPLRIQSGEVFNSSDLTLATYNNGAVVFDSATVATANDTNVGIGLYLPSAALHIRAGVATAGGAPIKLTSGTNLTTPEAGAIEFDGTHLYITDSTNARHTLVTADQNITLENKRIGQGGLWWRGSNSSSVSLSTDGKIYFNNETGTFKVSESGSNYADMLTSGRAIQSPLSTKTTAYTITATDSIILADTTATTFAVTLPDAAGITGKQYTIKQMTAVNFATIATTNTQTIDGAAGYTFSTQYETITVASDGVNWVIISNK